MIELLSIVFDAIVYFAEGGTVNLKGCLILTVLIAVGVLVFSF